MQYKATVSSIFILHVNCLFYNCIYKTFLHIFTYIFTWIWQYTSNYRLMTSWWLVFWPHLVPRYFLACRRTCSECLGGYMKTSLPSIFLFVLLLKTLLLVHIILPSTLISSLSLNHHRCADDTELSFHPSHNLHSRSPEWTYDTSIVA